ncbi:FxLD family lanthipeptide [Actinacidiphila bryophytorum]|uniref:FxLD family lanthipeptide n=1 Tax=Actinacidiphila bryophytorum TaxID=1436133 RepID=UPI002176967D|nr:FxLD family lanthipeptide [Actinacidiphila bryophytorum]UWE08703.1 FxLD family lanthipeptide [Actinacidiphila bryophytorum]
MSNATLASALAPAFLDEDFAPLDVKVVVAAHPFGKLQCSTGDGCGSTCSGGASACSSFVEDPA